MIDKGIPFHDVFTLNLLDCTKKYGCATTPSDVKMMSAPFGKHQQKIVFERKFFKVE